MKRLTFNPMNSGFMTRCNKPLCPHVTYVKKFFGLYEVPFCRFYCNYLDLVKTVDETTICDSWKQDIEESPLHKRIKLINEDYAEYEKWSENKEV